MVRGRSTILHDTEQSKQLHIVWVPSLIHFDKWTLTHPHLFRQHRHQTIKQLHEKEGEQQQLPNKTWIFKIMYVGVEYKEQLSSGDRIRLEAPITQKTIYFLILEEEIQVLEEERQRLVGTWKLRQETVPEEEPRGMRI